MVETVKTVHGEEVILLLDEAEAGNTRRSDGELVGQFISSCRLAGRRVARSSPTHIHTQHARTPRQKKGEWKKRTKKKKKKKRSAGEKLEKGRNKKKKKTTQKMLYSLPFPLFFSAFQVKIGLWKGFVFSLFLPSLFFRHFAQRKRLAHDE
ncbi:hypothetical protein OUZ56_004369 [Daphnia magna]|uniref:Uncharacterized protein n=1 Tax=Daphnia magna TaxID=35525 RepID=A0ABQ9YPK0_9CRUS|nr:hypothetical protein OUZ56_004369 [Daphnia magna]